MVFLLQQPEPTRTASYGIHRLSPHCPQRRCLVFPLWNNCVYFNCVSFWFLLLLTTHTCRPGHAQQPATWVLLFLLFVYSWAEARPHHLWAPVSLICAAPPHPSYGNGTPLLCTSHQMWSRMTPSGHVKQTRSTTNSRPLTPKKGSETSVCLKSD